jgi:hypothetical protein
MSLVRPELAAALHRWREPLAWGAVLAAGLLLIWRGYAGLAPGPLMLGLLMAGAGATLLRAAIRRIRLTAQVPGEGVVVIDEGRIAYLGPFGGGVVDLPRLTRVELTPASWILAADDGTRLVVPRGAVGAERLPDALTPLPGLDLDSAAEETALAGPVLVWQAPRTPRPELPR